jgi:predicted nucleic acid-binding protein
MSARVADASVMAAVIFKEPEEAQARQMLLDAEVHAPILLAFELASIARTKIVRYPGSREDFLSALDEVADLDIVWEEVDQTAIVQLALDTGLSTYDASYLFLARKLRLPLITFDRKLAAAAGNG